VIDFLLTKLNVVHCCFANIRRAQRMNSFNFHSNLTMAILLSNPSWVCRERYIIGHSKRLVNWRKYFRKFEMFSDFVSTYFQISISQTSENKRPPQKSDK